MAISHSSGSAGSSNFSASPQHSESSANAGSSAPDCSPASVFLSHAQQSHGNLPPSAACNLQPEPQNIARMAALFAAIRLELYQAGKNAGGELAAQHAIRERSRQLKQDGKNDADIIARIERDVLQESQELRSAALTTAQSLETVRLALSERDNAARKLQEGVKQTYAFHAHSGEREAPPTSFLPMRNMAQDADVAARGVVVSPVSSPGADRRPGQFLPVHEFFQRGLQDCLTSAKMHLAEAEARLKSNLAKELHHRYEALAGPADGSVRSAVEMMIAVHPELTGYTQFSGYLNFQAEALKKEPELRDRTKSILLNRNNIGLPKWQRDLVETDPVTLAIIQELGIADIPANNAETALAQLDPMAFALLKYAGGSLPENAGIFGMLLTPAEIVRVARSGIIRQLINLGEAEPEKIRQLIILVEASGSARREWVANQIIIILEGETASEAVNRENNHADRQRRFPACEDAFKLLKMQINRCYTARQIEDIWQAVEAPLKNYVDAQAASIAQHLSSEENETKDAWTAAAWLKAVGRYAIPPSAGLLIDAVTDNFDARLLAREGGSELMHGLQIVIDKAPHYAASIAEWIVDDSAEQITDLAGRQSHGGNSVNMQFMTPSEDADGRVLAQAIMERISKRNGPEAADTLRMVYNARIGEIAVKLNDKRNEWLYQRFMENPGAYVQAMFDELLYAKADIFSVEHNISEYSQQDRQELIGAALLAMTGGGGAGAAVIEQVDRWILESGGADARIIFVPTVYADGKAGVAGLPLIRIRRADSEVALIDASAALAATKGQGVRWRYEDLNNFIEDNQLNEEGRLYMTRAADLLLKSNSQGQAEVNLDGVAAGAKKAWENTRRAREDIIAVGGGIGGDHIIAEPNSLAVPVVLSDAIIRDAWRRLDGDVEHYRDDQSFTSSAMIGDLAWKNYIEAYAGNLWIGRLQTLELHALKWNRA